jgi:epoxide hydrolase 4
MTTPLIPNTQPTEETIQTQDGYKLSVKTFGPREGRPILFLHGFPEFWYGWRNQIPFFEEQGYYVVVPDQRGYNDSDKPNDIGDYTLNHLSDDVASIVEQLHLKDTVLVGHDWGAAAAWHAAIRFPMLFSKLVILNVPHPRVFIKTLFTNIRQFGKSWYMYFFQLPKVPEGILSLVGYEKVAEGMRSTARAGTFSDADVEAYVAAWSKPDAMRSMINWYRAAFQRPDLRSDVQVHVPTLILWGAQDTFLEAKMAEESIKYCDKARVRYFDSASHWLQHEEPAQVNQAIDAFIAEK